MAKINDILFKQIQERIEEGYINTQRHPGLQNYTIYNYSQSAAFDNVWDDATKWCRGLILDDDLNIIARPFPKFFNWEQHDPADIPMNESFRVFDKEDGSLGILYWYKEDDNGFNLPYIATRGSFSSEQANKGLELLDFTLHNNPVETLDWLTEQEDNGLTPLFEIVYPENRIVLDYKGFRGLIYLGSVNKETGEVIRDYENVPFRTCKEYDGLKDFAQIKALNTDNKEGFVLQFESGFMMKIKFEEYCRLHSVLTNVSTKIIWRYMKDGLDFKDLIENVPDEFYNWVMEQRDDLQGNFNFIEATAKAELKVILNKMGTIDSAMRDDKTFNKDFAERVKNHRMKHFLFALKNGKDISQSIWKMIKPDYATPFAVDVDNPEEADVA